MIFWKIDEETIRCLINKEEIDDMGFDIQSLSHDAQTMNEFIKQIIENSFHYVKWDTANGVQSVAARSLPAEQFLITISCTFLEVAIDRDLEQIKKMTTALKSHISEERINEIYNMSGEEKQKAFEELSRDLQNVCNGNTLEEDAAAKTATSDETYHENNKEAEQPPAKTEAMAPQKLIFSKFSDLVNFCSLLSDKFYLPSRLYKGKEGYVMILEFPETLEKTEVISFLITAEEYGAKCSQLYYENQYLSEHGEIIIDNNCIEVLHSLGEKA